MTFKWIMFFPIRWIDKTISRYMKFIELPGGRELVRFELRAYSGEKRILRDGSILEKGTDIIWIHTNNRKMAEIDGSFREVAGNFVYELKSLLEEIKTNDKYRNVAAVMTVSALYPIMKRMNFDISEYKGGKYSKGKKMWMNLLLAAWSRSSRPKGNTRDIRMCTISLAQLRKRLGIGEEE